MPDWTVLSRDPVYGRNFTSPSSPSKETALIRARDLWRQRHEIIRIEGPHGAIEKEASRSGWLLIRSRDPHRHQAGRQILRGRPALCSSQRAAKSRMNLRASSKLIGFLGGLCLEAMCRDCSPNTVGWFMDR
jgi:hypothetical protein